MLSGHMERRTSHRVPLETSVSIIFKRDGQELVEAQAIDIGPGGMKFMAPQGSLALTNGEEIAFDFDLPGHGVIQVSAMVTYLGYLTEHGSDAMNIYGAKFYGLSLESWNNIVAYCQRISPDVPSAEQPKAKVCAPEKTLNIICPVFLHLSNGQNIEGKLKDVSFGGVRILLHQSLDLKEKVIMELTLGQRNLRLKAVCVWCFLYDEEKSLYLAGIYFSKLTAEEFSQIKMLIAKGVEA